MEIERVGEKDRGTQKDPETDRGRVNEKQYIQRDKTDRN